MSTKPNILIDPKARLCFFATLLLLLPQISFAQYKLDWVTTFGSNQKDWPTSIDYDNQGNVYVTGVFRGTIDLDPGSGTANVTSLGWEDIFVAKYSSNGNYVWGFSIGSTFIDYGTAINVSRGSGFIFVAGSYSQTMDADPSAAVFNLSANTNSALETFIAKYDLNGNFIDAVSFEGLANPSSNYPQSMSSIINGNVIIAGYFSGTVDFDPRVGTNNKSDLGNGDMYIAKLDQSLNLIWVQTIGDTLSEFLRSVEQNNNGDILIGGSYRGTVDFEPGAGTSFHTSANGGYDIFLAKYDASGAYLWSDAMGGTTSFTDEGYAVGFDSNNDAIICGSFYGSVDFDPGAGTYNLTSNNHYSGFFGKYQGSNGNLIWCKGLIHPTTNNKLKLYSLEIDQQDHIYLWGQFEGGGANSLDIDPGIGTYPLPVCNPSLLNMEFMAHYDSNGDVVCANTICPTTSLGQNYIKDKALRVYKDQAIYMAGVYNTNSITSSPCNSAITTPFLGQFDVYVAKFNIQLEGEINAAKDTVCAGDSIWLKASGGSIYTWSNGLTSDSIAIIPTGDTTISVVVDQTCGCTKPDTVEINITTIDSVSVLIAGDSLICPGDTIVLTASGSSSFLWSTGSSNSQITVSPSTSTVYQVTSTEECAGAPYNFVVNISSLPNVNAGADTTINNGNVLTLNASGAVSYEWSPSEGLSCTNCPSPSASPTTEVTYCVTGVDSLGCSNIDCITILLEEICKGLYIPTAFSPNNDGSNDYFEVYGNCIKGINLNIYSRWGELLYSINDHSDKWDGTYKGQPCNFGVYLYSVEIITNQNEEISRKGNITLVR